ncbi:hypothetical protein BRD03_01435 [Halobacteriales archaeon QS_9_68_17]|nr:MAG: hypothetical protein BRD03_01435 [Halobacteriales archaeon QS_9_68_17]
MIIRSDAAGEFVSATDFEESVLLFVAAAAPNACDDRVGVTDLRVDGDRRRKRRGDRLRRGRLRPRRAGPRDLRRSLRLPRVAVRH